MRMTLQRAIDLCDSLRPNRYDDGVKKGWLSQLDGRVKEEILDTHEHPAEIPFPGYDENTPGETHLLVQGTHEDIYVKWLMSQVDFHDGEPERYNNSAALFNAAWQELERCVHRALLPLQPAKITF